MLIIAYILLERCRVFDLCVYVAMAGKSAMNTGNAVPESPSLGSQGQILSCDLRTKTIFQTVGKWRCKSKTGRQRHITNSLATVAS